MENSTTTTSKTCYTDTDVIYVGTTTTSITDTDVIYVDSPGVTGLTGYPGTTGEPGATGPTGPTGAPNTRIPSPNRLLPQMRVRSADKRKKWLALLHENNSRRG